MTFVTVYDAARDGWGNLWFPAFGLIFVAIGAVMAFARDPKADMAPGGPRGYGRRIFGWGIGIFAILWTILASIVVARSYIAAAYDLIDGRCSVIEGRVANFVPMPYEGHADESFVLAGQRFAYSDYEITSGFNQTASHGGPMRDGLYVRLCYRDNRILRLEVAK